MEKTIHANILILGAGIGGYETWRSLARQLRRAGLKKKIIIVDQHNYFTFVPLLHEVASGAVEPEHATLSLREVVAGTPHEFIKARVKSIAPAEKYVALDRPEIACAGLTYDQCVVALGSAVNYYGTPGAAEYSYHVRTVENALAFRHALINRFDTPDPHITITVIGGGSTGVEVAGQLGYLVSHDLKKLYPKKTSAVRLIEAGGELVSALPSKARRLAARRLQRLGVKIFLNTKVRAVHPGQMVLAPGENLESDLTLWAAGIKNIAAEVLPPDYCAGGRIPVNDWLQHPRDPDLYAIGDMASCSDTSCNLPVPQLGEAAHRQGEYLARHLVARLAGRPPGRGFHFVSKGTLMSIGEHYGLIVRGSLVVAGFWAWVIRRAVYLWFMPGVARKLKIVVDWGLRRLGFADIISIPEAKHPSAR